MQAQARILAPPAQFFQGRLRLLAAPAQDKQVVGVADHRIAHAGHVPVQPVQIDIGQQRRDHSPLRGAFLGFSQPPLFHHALPQKSLHQGQHPPVADPLPDPLHELGPRNRVEVALPVGFHHMPMSRSEQQVHLPQRVFAAASGPEPIAVVRKPLLKDRFHHMSQRRFHRPVPYGRDAQGSPVPAARLRNVDPPDCLRPVAALSQPSFQPLQLLFLFPLELLHGDMIHPRRSLVRHHLPEGRSQVLAPVHLVNQAEPLASFHTVFQCFQHPVCPHRRFHPVPPGPDLSGLLSPQAHCRRLLFLPCVHPLSPFLPVLRSLRVTGVHRSYAGSDFPPASRLRRDLPASRTRPSDRSVTKHPWRPAVAFSRYPSAPQASPAPPGSGLHLSYADSPSFRPYRVRRLRTGRSPPVAPHPASRRMQLRSVIRLRRRERMPGADSHRSVRVRSQAHVGRACRAFPAAANIRLCPRCAPGCGETGRRPTQSDPRNDNRTPTPVSRGSGVLSNSGIPGRDEGSRRAGRGPRTRSRSAGTVSGARPDSTCRTEPTLCWRRGAPPRHVVAWRRRHPAPGYSGLPTQFIRQAAPPSCAPKDGSGWIRCAPLPDLWQPSTKYLHLRRISRDRPT